MIRGLSQVLLAAALTVTAVGSSDQSSELISLLEKSQSEINTEVKGLSAAQMEFKPAADRWSVGDILEHITRTETFLLDLITAKVLSSAPQPEKKDVERQRSSDAKLLAQIADRTQKGTAPEELQPKREWKGNELIAEFNKRRAVTIDFVKGTKLDLRSYFADERDAHQWFLLIGAHTQRHLAQMREVKASSGYPKSLAQQDSKVRIVLQGLDPVELVDGKQVNGTENLSVIRERYRYLFTSIENKAKFERFPEEYQIQMGGGCGSMGPLSGAGDPDRFYVHARRIFIFASESCRNTFKAAPEKFIDTADAPPSGSEAERARGQYLIKKALAGFGGASRVDSLTSLEVRTRLIYKQGEKETVGTKTTIFHYPGKYRVEEVWGESRFAEVLLPERAISLSGDDQWPRENTVRLALERDLYRHPVALLKARTLPDFIALAAGYSKVSENEVELLRVWYKGATTILGIDKDTGRVLQAAFRGRRGGYGDIVRTFSDFREVDGISFPFSSEESFNGKLIANPLVVYESIKVNHELDPVLFPIAQSNATSALELYQVGFLKKGPAWTADQTDETREIQSAHMAHIKKMADSGKLVAAGPVLDGGELRGLFIFKAASLDEARALTSADPAVKSRRLAFEVLPWMGTRDIGKKFREAYQRNPDTKQTMTTHYLGLAKRGSGWKASEAQSVLTDHMKFVGHLLADGKARAAGPFVHDVDPRGMYVLVASSKDEARQWADLDPAVKAGHMTVEVVSWLVAKEVWP